METVGDAVGQVDCGDGVESGRVEDGQVATVRADVVDKIPSARRRLRGFGALRDEDEFAGIPVLSQPPKPHDRSVC